MSLHKNKFSAYDKFFELVDSADFQSRITKEESCWSFKTRRKTKTYSHIWIASVGINLLAHRYSFWLHNGKRIDSYLVIDHKCRNKWCVNPEHLRNVSLRVNALENSDSVVAINNMKKNCSKGHELIGENLIIKKNGSRRCRTCHNKNERERSRRIKNGI